MNLRMTCLLMVLSLGLVGCGPSGPKLYPVTGKITFDGEPVSEGNIAFVPTDGSGAAQGGSFKDGVYSVKVAQGPKRVEIYGERKSGKKETQEDGRVVELKESFIPSKYNNNSELTVTIEPESATHDFELTGKK